MAFILPVMGGWYDRFGSAAAFRYVAVMPMVLTFIFGGLYFYHRGEGAIAM